VLFWSRATRDLLKSFGWGIATLHRLIQRRSCHPRRPPHSISPLEGNGFELFVPRRGKLRCRGLQLLDWEIIRTSWSTGSTARLAGREARLREATVVTYRVRRLATHRLQPRGASSIRAAPHQLFFESPQTTAVPPTFQQELASLRRSVRHADFAGTKRASNSLGRGLARRLS
jgi:hypothetical protein